MVLVEKTNKIIESVEPDHHMSTASIAQKLKIAQKAVGGHLKMAGQRQKLDECMPHELTRENLLNLILICESLLNRI